MNYHNAFFKLLVMLPHHRPKKLLLFTLLHAVRIFFQINKFEEEVHSRHKREASSYIVSPSTLSAR